MISGVGIDSIEIKRFNDWHNYSKNKLKKIFSEHEIEYCLNIKKKTAERFAARFAVKEAFFKAFCQLNPENKIPFLQICRSIEVKSNPGKAPNLLVDWSILYTKKKILSLVSITHTNSQSTAIVLLESYK